MQPFVELTFEALGLDHNDYIVQDPRFKRPAEVELLVGNPDKAHTKMGWEADTSFDSLVRTMVAAELDQLKNCCAPINLLYPKNLTHK